MDHLESRHAFLEISYISSFLPLSVIQIMKVISFLHYLFIFASITELARSDEAVISVGKLRASADVAFSSGDLDQALNLWAKVIEIEPENENNYYKRFRIYLRQNRLKEALADLNAAIRIKSNFETALVQRAKLSLRLGKCIDAESDFATIRKINPNNKDLSSQGEASSCSRSIKDADVAFLHKNWIAAKDLYSNAIRIAEASSMLLLKRAHTLYQLGEFYESIADTGKILKIEADSIAVSHWLALNRLFLLI